MTYQRLRLYSRNRTAISACRYDTGRFWKPSNFTTQASWTASSGMITLGKLVPRVDFHHASIAA
jgi:hypothetical protein